MSGQFDTQQADMFKASTTLPLPSSKFSFPHMLVSIRSHHIAFKHWLDLAGRDRVDCDPEDYDIAALPSHALSALEADTFWCLSKLLDGIQDNYIFAQPGIHRQVARCQELCLRVDGANAKIMPDMYHNTDKLNSWNYSTTCETSSNGGRFVSSILVPLVSSPLLTSAAGQCCRSYVGHVHGRSDWLIDDRLAFC